MSENVKLDQSHTELRKLIFEFKVNFKPYGLYENENAGHVVETYRSRSDHVMENRGPKPTALLKCK